MGLAKIFISKKALAPSGAFPVGHVPFPPQDRVAQLVFQAEVRSRPFPVTALSNPGQPLQVRGHRTWMWTAGGMCLLGGAEAAGKCQGLLCLPQGQPRAGAVEVWRVFRSQPLDSLGGSSELGSRDHQIRERQHGDQRPVKCQPTPHSSDGETESQEEKGSRPRQHSEFSSASSTETFARVRGVVVK